MSGAFTCSLDDGYLSDMKAADLLVKHDVSATFYIPIRNREGLQVLPAAQIREIGTRFEIGSHTYDHCFLKGIGFHEAEYQVIEGKKQLEDLLGHQVLGFCYPGGKYRQQHVDLVKVAGFQYARTTTNLCYDTGNQPFEMPTTFQFYPHDRNVYFRNFIKGGDWMKRQPGLKIALQHENWIDRLYALFDYALASDGVFHLWGHSKDIDDLNAWGALDRFLAYVASKIPPEDRLTNEQLANRGFLSFLPENFAATV
jgi:peptidoglycan/xylan/chitin deacetylase (PgdA/CDA1 family)